MKTAVTLRNLEGMGHLKEFIEDCAEKSIGKFDKHHSYETRIIMHKDSARGDIKNSDFECEVMVRDRGLPAPVIVKKSDHDFYRSVRMAMRAAEISLGKFSKVKARFRRKWSPQLVSES